VPALAGASPPSPERGGREGGISRDSRKPSGPSSPECLRLLSERRSAESLRTTLVFRSLDREREKDSTNHAHLYRKLISYAGLAPIVRQSGERAQYGPINREGRRELRWAWGQVAQRVAWYPDPQAKPLQLWFLRIARRRGKKTAIVALTRKLLTIAYHVLKYNEEYDPSRVFRAGLANKGFKAERVRRPEKRSSR